MTQSIKARFMSKVRLDEATGCWEWAASKRGEYGQFHLDGKVPHAHRVSYALRYGPIQDGLHVLHRCDNPGCVNPEHLFLGTQTENMADRDVKGRQACQQGAGNNHAKLTEDDVLAIRAASGTQQTIADRFGITRAMVSQIRLRKAWAHL